VRSTRSPIAGCRPGAAVADEPLVLELDAGRGGPVRVEWDPAALADAGRDEAAARPFALRGGLDPERWELARVLSGALADGRRLAVAALRPRDAAGHGDDAIGGVVVRDGEVTVLDEVLLSVEYGPDGEARRIGLEVYERPDSLPVRVAGDRSGRSATGDVTFALRAGDVEGSALLATVGPA
jgi:hypothetical protein